MLDREKVIKGLESLRDVCNAKADMAIGEGRTAWAGYASVVHLALAMLREQEPEIVRCKDCKYYRYYGPDSYTYSECTLEMTEGPEPTFFCACGEGR